MYRISGIKDFDLTHIFECGQCFRWTPQRDGSYKGIAMGRVVNVYFDGGTLAVDPCTPEEFEAIWRPYFDLDRDYGKIKKTLAATDSGKNKETLAATGSGENKETLAATGSGDHVMARATAYGHGIRILKQDLWETIVSFIISQNNNIPRIKGCIERLSDNFGTPISPDRNVDALSDAAGSKGPAGTSIPHDIPTPEALASLTEEDLAPVRLGYRAKYLIETSRHVIECGLPKTFDDISELTGVGPKVASCIALFGMQDYSSFPIDVWVMRVMHELYGLDEKNKKAMAEFARERFGELGGFAQQYLFYYMRDLA